MHLTAFAWIGWIVTMRLLNGISTCVVRIYYYFHEKCMDNFKVSIRQYNNFTIISDILRSHFWTISFRNNTSLLAFCKDFGYIWNILQMCLNPIDMKNIQNIFHMSKTGVLKCFLHILDCPTFKVHLSKSSHRWGNILIFLLISDVSNSERHSNISKRSDSWFLKGLRWPKLFYFL